MVVHSTWQSKIATMLSSSVRELCREVKKGRAFEVRKTIRRVKLAKFGGAKKQDETEDIQENGQQADEQKVQINNSADDSADEKTSEKGANDNADKAKQKKKKQPSLEVMEKRLEAVKKIDYHVITTKLVRTVGVDVPNRILDGWYQKKEKDGNLLEKPQVEDKDLESFLNTVIARIKNRKDVVAAVRKVAEACEIEKANNRKRKKAEKRKRRDTEEEQKLRKIPCNMGNCGARFKDNAARVEHWKKRHSENYRRIVEEQGLDVDDPYLADQLQPKKKNRTGQRERQKQAMERLHKERQEAIARGETPPPLPKRPKKAPKTNVEEDSKAAEDELHPSWAAKKKQQDLVEFKGSRVTFDESDDESEA